MAGPSVSYAPLQQVAPAPTAAGPHRPVLPVRIDTLPPVRHSVSSRLSAPVSSTPYIELLEVDASPAKPKELPPQAEFAMAQVNLEIDGEPGYMGIFVNQTKFTKQELAYTVEQLKTQRSVFGVLRSLNNFKLDSRWTGRHVLLHILLELICLWLSYCMLRAICDVTDVSLAGHFWIWTPRSSAIAIVTFVVSWSCHVLVMLTFYVCKSYGPSFIDWWMACRGFSTEDADERADEPAAYQHDSKYMIDARTGQAVEVEIITKDVKNPERAIRFEEQTSILQILFTWGLLTQFIQYFVYLFLFAHAYPSFCPTERGPYSCQRMNEPVNMRFNDTAHDLLTDMVAWFAGIQTHFAAPRYMDSINGTYPIPELSQSEQVPYSMAVPKILWGSRDGKESMCILAHFVPIIFGLYWINENRRVTHLLVDWAEQQSGREPLSEKHESLRYRQAIMFLAMVYHTVIPRATHVMHRFGSLFLDLVDIQDFWSLLVEFDLYEGREIDEPYWSFLGFNLCNLTQIDPPVVTCQLEKCISGYLAAAVPEWWKPYKDKYSPCEELQAAADEWFVGNHQVWEGNERGEEWFYKLGVPRSRANLYVLIKCWYAATVFMTLIWPVVLYFRHTGSRRREREEGFARKFLRAGLPGDRSQSHKVDNREALWNAWRSLVVNGVFISIRFYASNKLGIIASSLLIKNAMLIASSMLTICQYFVWSWANADKWPELHKSRGARNMCDKIAWCGVQYVPRWVFLKVLGWWMPKAVVIPVTRTEDKDGRPVDVALMREIMGREDDDDFYREVTVTNAKNERQQVLKAGRAYLMLPGKQLVETVDSTDPDDVRETSIERFEIGADDRHARLEDFEVEKHVASLMLQNLS